MIRSAPPAGRLSAAHCPLLSDAAIALCGAARCGHRWCSGQPAVPVSSRPLPSPPPPFFVSRASPLPRSRLPPLHPRPLRWRCLFSTALPSRRTPLAVPQGRRSSAAGTRPATTSARSPIDLRGRCASPPPCPQPTSLDAASRSQPFRPARRLLSLVSPILRPALKFMIPHHLISTILFSISSSRVLT